RDDGGRAGRAGDRAIGRALRPLPLARGGELRRPRPVRHAQGLRRPRRTHKGRLMDVAAPALSPAGTAPPQPPPPPADPPAFVIFGASGDLTKRLLVPALYNLASARLLPDEFAVIGVARGEMSDDAFRDRMGGALREFATGTASPDTVRDLTARFSYVRGDFD